MERCRAPHSFATPVQGPWIIFWIWQRTGGDTPSKTPQSQARRAVFSEQEPIRLCNSTRALARDGIFLGTTHFVLQCRFFGAGFEALKVCCATTTFFDFVALLAHKCER